jgi:hypothetical protein
MKAGELPGKHLMAEEERRDGATSPNSADIGSCAVTK